MPILDDVFAADHDVGHRVGVARKDEAVDQGVTPAAEEQRMTGARLTRALSSGNMDAADSQREAIWFALYRVYHKLEEVTEIWNAVAPRAGRVK